MWSQFRRWAERLFEARLAAVEAATAPIAGLVSDVAALQVVTSTDTYEDLNETLTLSPWVPAAAFSVGPLGEGESYEYGIFVTASVPSAHTVVVSLMWAGFAQRDSDALACSNLEGGRWFRARIVRLPGELYGRAALGWDDPLSGATKWTKATSFPGIHAAATAFNFGGTWSADDSTVTLKIGAAYIRRLS